MNRFKYTIPRIPPSMNKFYGRGCRWQYWEAKDEWEGYVNMFCSPVPSEPIPQAEVTITYYFPDRRRRDSDNYNGKFIMDGLVKKRVLEDDSFTNIKVVLIGDYDKENPRTEIKVTPIDSI